MTLSEVEKVCERLISANLSISHFIILSSLSHEERNMTFLARLCRHSTAATTGTIDRMEQMGFVERSRTIDDRRNVMVRLTKSGVDKLNSVVGKKS